MVKASPHNFEDQTLLLQEALDQLLPDQLALDQLAPDQEALDQEALDQLAPDQEALDQEALDQLAPDQEALDQEALDQLEPFQVPPDQLALCAAAVDHEALSNLTPKMSCSPSRTTVPSISFADPLARSSRPVPEGAAYFWRDRGVFVFSAFPRLKVPAPWQTVGEFSSGRDDSMRRALT